MTEYPDGWLTNLSKYIGGLNEELEKAKAENDYLREMLSESRQANEKLLVELKRYKNTLRARPIAMILLFKENTKLRELVRTLVYCHRADNDYAVSCDGCAMNGADMHVTIDGTFACDGLQHELKSLGIEVSE
jgi:hypothetical protein